MFPQQGPMSDGPPPPEMRGENQPPPMPPSVISAAGAGQGRQMPSAGNMDALGQQAINLATQKLLEFRTATEGLLTAMKALDPDSVPEFLKIVEWGKAMEARLQQVAMRQAQGQPNMAGQPQQGATQQPQAQGPPGGAGPEQAEGAGGPPMGM